MTENILTEKKQIPEKFLNNQTGEINVDALLNSYLNLEKKMSTSMNIPNENSSEEEIKSFYRAIGVPENADEYKIIPSHPMLEVDKEVNEKLRQLGFTNKQLQAVYDLAGEKVLPIINELAMEFEADKQRQALYQFFGSKENFNSVAPQILSWAQSKLPAEVVDALSTTYDGVMCMYQMMNSNEPKVLNKISSDTEVLDEDGLKKIMRDPKYWKDQDPDIVKKVADGFKRLYP